MRRSLWYPWMEKKTDTLYVQIPEKEVQEQEEQEQTQKLTAEEQEQKDMHGRNCPL